MDDDTRAKLSNQETYCWLDMQLWRGRKSSPTPNRNAFNYAFCASSTTSGKVDKTKGTSFDKKMPTPWQNRLNKRCHFQSTRHRTF